MTLEQAQSVKTLLMKCQGTIPSDLVHPIFNEYKTHISPGATMPCTCSPKSWNELLRQLKDRVETTLNGI